MVSYTQISVSVIGFKELAFNGSNVTSACPTGRTLNGPDTLTCMGNGEWEPDPIKLNARMKALFK